jgi:hypothetical protein
MQRDRITDAADAICNSGDTTEQLRPRAVSYGVGFGLHENSIRHRAPDAASEKVGLAPEILCWMSGPRAR